MQVRTISSSEKTWAVGAVRSAKSLVPIADDGSQRSAVVIQIGHQNNLVRGQHIQLPAETIRESVCSLCEKLVCMKLEVSLKAMRARTRSIAEIALARQIAMYLAHTMFSVLMTEVGLHFGRDRTTVAHACALVEDRRDEFVFDTMICQLEAALEHAVDAIAAAASESEVTEVTAAHVVAR